MTIYKKRTPSRIYRKIYEQYHGPIPKDEEGRTFEIHHIDGNSNNNDPANLVALSIQEHYDLHYSQGDWAACRFMAIHRLKKSADEISELSIRNQRKLLENGTHHFQDSEFQRNLQIKRIENGTHSLMKRADGSSVSSDRVKDGTHNFLDSVAATERNLKRVENGTHHFLDAEKARERANKMVEDGTHPFLDGEKARTLANKRISEGTHNLIGPDSPSQLQWTCDDCGKSGKGKGNQTQHRKKYCKKA